MSALSEIQNQLRNKNPQTQILAVSKLQSVEKIRTLYSQGQRKFAENYAQEALSKQEALKDLDIEWHFIGSLQKNKVKFVVGNFFLIHSVDSLFLAETIDRKAAEKGLIQKILLQFNLAGEASKGGFSLENFSTLLLELKNLKSVEIVGLMTMPPLSEDPEDARPFFKKLSSMRDQFSLNMPQLKQLSMGTSSDYLVAAEEGATIVRLGTILFGERPGKKP
ncbi:MAG: YggS family pyridoxal phosphate-dependent enzyme [Pseudobdellovibrionaceae bacterium]